MSKIEQKLAELSLELPQVAKPVAAYIPAIQVGNLVTTSGQLPVVNGALTHAGSVGEGGLATEQAALQARQSCLNALAAVKSIIGDLDRVKRVVRLVVYVQSKDGFHGQPQVANGASVLLQDVFGEKGQHVRSAIGVNALPLNAPVEVELTVEV